MRAEEAQLLSLYAALADVRRVLSAVPLDLTAADTARLEALATTLKTDIARARATIG